MAVEVGRAEVGGLEVTGDYETRLVALDEIMPSPWNPRTITAEDFRALVKSLEAWPRFLLANPVKVQASSGHVIGGNMRYRGLAQIARSGRYPSAYRLPDGRPGVPAKILDYDDATAKAFALVDNNLVGDWQPEETGEILEQLREVGIDPQTLSFKPLDLEALLESSGSGSPTAPLPEGVDSPPEDAPSRVRLGEVWACGPHRVMCGDSTQPGLLALLMAGDVADLVVTSPPYWIGREYEQEHADGEIRAHITRATAAISGVMAEESHIALNTGTTVATKLGGDIRDTVLLLDWWKAAFHDHDWYLRNVRIWTKEGGFSGFSPSQDVVGQGWEFLASFARAKPRPQNRVGERWALDGVWDCQPQIRSVDHSAPYPVEIPRRFIALYTDPEAVVLDPYLGSGTTLVAADALGRICYGMDLDPRSCDVALARWEALTGLEAKRVLESHHGG